MNYYDHRVAFLCISSSLGGLELSTIHLAESLTERGAKTLLILPPSSPLEARAKSLNMDVKIIKPISKYGDIFAAAKLSMILKEFRIDRLIIMQSKDINIAALAKIFYSKVKIVYYQQMQSTIQKKDFLHNWVYSKLSLWIALTNRMKKDVVNCTNVPEDMIKVIPLGLDSHKFDPDLYNQIKERTYFDLPKDKYIVGMIGRLDIKKGQESFLRAIPGILKQHKKVLFVIVGEETRGEEGYREELIRLCKDLKIEEHVKFLPFTEEVPRFLSSLDVFVLPSDEETFGLVVIEAMAMQKPVIATNAGGVPEIINDGQNGLLVQPKDSMALAEAIQKVLDDFFLRYNLSIAARDRAVHNFDFVQCVDRIAESIEYI
jgi:D-inositol-3-phosphate glycosyltransferase